MRWHISDLLSTDKLGALRRHIEKESPWGCHWRCQSVANLVLTKRVVIFQSHIKKLRYLLITQIDLMWGVEIVC
jgi:hypothetical protein